MQSEGRPYPTPGFLIANIGQHRLGLPQLVIQTNGSWDKFSGKASATWIIANPRTLQDKGEAVLFHAYTALLT